MGRRSQFFVILASVSALVLGGCAQYAATPPTVASSPEQHATAPSQLIPSSSAPSRPIIQTPNLPTNLVIQPQSQNTAYLQWSDTANNEDGFRIYRDGNVVGTVPANTLSYQDTSLKAAKTYNYMVRAYNPAGESGAASYTLKMPNPPINVALNYIGVKFAHDPWSPPGDIKLYVLISDGVQKQEFYLPAQAEGAQYKLNDYETTSELNQLVFRAVWQV
jgi:hypothetical protein